MAAAFDGEGCAVIDLRAAPALAAGEIGQSRGNIELGQRQSGRLDRLGLGEDGLAESREDGQPAEKLDLNELVSMNMWGLTPAFMDTLYDGFVEFLQNVKAGDIKAEYLLPVMIDALIQKGTAQVDVLETKDTWFGVTYQEDKEVVIKAFKELTEAGVYPNGLYK